jgi:hypothetical protein
MKIEEKLLCDGTLQLQPDFEVPPSVQRHFAPLALEVRTHVDTASAENGPLRPIRVNGRLAWPVSEIRRVLRT